MQLYFICQWHLEGFAGIFSGVGLEAITISVMCTHAGFYGCHSPKPYRRWGIVNLIFGTRSSALPALSLRGLVWFLTCSGLSLAAFGRALGELVGFERVFKQGGGLSFPIYLV